MNVKLKVFKKDDNKEFRLVQTLTMGEVDVNQLKRFRNQLAFSAEKFGREDHLSPVMKPTLSKDVDEQLKLAHNVVAVVDRAIYKREDFIYLFDIMNSVYDKVTANKPICNIL